MLVDERQALTKVPETLEELMSFGHTMVQSDSVTRLLLAQDILNLSHGNVATSRMSDETRVSLSARIPLPQHMCRQLLPDEIKKLEDSPLLHARHSCLPITVNGGQYFLQVLEGWLTVNGDLRAVLERFQTESEDEFLRRTLPADWRVEAFDMQSHRESQKLSERLLHMSNASIFSVISGKLELCLKPQSVDELKRCDAVILCESRGALSACSHRAHSCWSLANCGGTPIPVRPHVPGDEVSWAKNPQFFLEIFSASSEIEIEVHLVVQRAEEIFVCLMHCEGDSRLTRFDKDRIVKTGGASRLQQSTVVSFSAHSLRAGKYIIVPSTWKTDLQVQFDLFVRVCGGGGFLESTLTRV